MRNCLLKKCVKNMAVPIDEWKSDYTLNLFCNRNIDEFKLKVFGVDEHYKLFKCITNIVDNIRTATERIDSLEIVEYKDDLFTKSVLTGEDLLELHHRILLIRLKYPNLSKLKKNAQIFTVLLEYFQYFIMN